MLRAVLVVLTVLLGLTGCSDEVDGDATVSRSDVENQISTELGKTVGREPEEVTCPDDLVGKVGEKMRCSLSDSGTDLGVTVTVTKVEDGDVKFDIVVDRVPPA